MKPVLVLVLVALVAGCSFQQQADTQFGDQHFKTAIALIELHKVGTGQYPQTLGELRYTGNWDAIATRSVEYRRLGDGYELDIRRGWVGAPQLAYPADFWRGLGIVATKICGLPVRKPSATIGGSP